MKIKGSLGILLLVAGCYLTGCYYQFGQGALACIYRTISVPYIEGDQKGELTAEVIKQLSLSGAFHYVNESSDLILKIKIIELRDENIGFRYDRKKRGKLRKSIIPTETRVSAQVEVLLVDKSGQTIRGPTRIVASTDFDHSYYSSRHAINIFSLGQLNDLDAAHDAAMRPLNRHLAERIVDYLVNSW